MFDKHFIGQNAAGITAAPQFAPISKVVLLVDDERSFVAGDDTGREMELTCPYGSQDMADDLLSRLQGYAYRPMTAQDALLDPAAELGDGVTVGGVYTVLAEMDTLFDMHCATDIAAPGEDEVDSEYKYQTPEKRLERQLATTRSLIAKTAEEIRLEVAGVEDEISYIQLDLESITSRVQDAEGNISTLEQTATSLRSAISGKLDSDEAQSLIDQTLEGIELSVSSSGGSTTFRLTADGVLLSTKTLDLTVDAVNISGTLTAGALRGGTVSLLTAAERQAGGIEITGSSSSSYAIELYSNAALRLAAYGSYAAAYLEAGGSAALGISVVGSLGYLVSVNRSLIPAASNLYCGMASYKWEAVYAETETIQTSDANRKTDIENLPDKYVVMFDLLTPKRARMINGTSGRYHPCYIAQDVKAAMDAAGVDSLEFGGWVRDYDEDGNEIYMLRYGEFDAIRDAKIKQLDARLTALEEKSNEV